MAKIMEAANEFGLKLELEPTAHLDQVAEWTAACIGSNKDEVLIALQEESDVILNFCKKGTPVKIPGVGTFIPSMNRSGELSINFRAETAQKNGMNIRKVYTGELKNRANAGITSDQLKALWDAAHPNDPLEIS